MALSKNKEEPAFHKEPEVSADAELPEAQEESKLVEEITVNPEDQTDRDEPSTSLVNHKEEVEQESLENNTDPLKDPSVENTVQPGELPKQAKDSVQDELNEDDEANDVNDDGKQDDGQPQEYNNEDADEQEEDEGDRSNSHEKYKNLIKELLMKSSAPKKAKKDEEDEDEDAINHQMNEYWVDNPDDDDDRYFNSNKVKQVKQHDIYKDGPATELSNDILSYERFYPGRILGNTFTIINKTNETLIITLNFTRDSLSKEYITHKLMEFYEATNVEDIDQPYQRYIQQEIIDAEKQFEWWFIEDPYSKTLVKQVRYELGPQDSFEFIIVLKSPIIKKTYFLTTNINVENQTHGERHRVFAFGSLDVPKLSCPKEIMDKDNNYACVKVVMRKKVPLQIFKFLMLNRGDMPVNVNFSSLENDDLLMFSIKNPNMIIDGNTRVILEVKAHHKYKSIPDKLWKTTNNHKLIIGKIKDWELKFSLIVNVIIL